MQNDTSQGPLGLLLPSGKANCLPSMNSLQLSQETDQINKD